MAVGIPTQATGCAGSSDAPSDNRSRTDSPMSVPALGISVLPRITFAIYVVLLGLFIVVRGLPLDRLWQALWIIAGITAAMAGRPISDYFRVLRDWSLFFAALLLYDHTRGIADTLGMPLHVSDIVAVEKVMFGGIVPTEWLQDHLYDTAHIHWYDVALSLVYLSHFCATWIIGAVIYVRSREAWGSYARRALGLSFAGLLTYILAPAAPPWWAANAGVIGDVERISSRGWTSLGLHGASSALEAAQAGVNRVAALPSLHAAFSLLVMLILWPRARAAAVRGVLVVYPLAMGFALVYFGEHYVADVILGWIYAVVVVLLARRYERRRGPEPSPSYGSDDRVEVVDGRAMPRG
jgi:membrane-associated phospholipid phosphatase